MEKEYEELQFAENEFSHTYSLALKSARNNKNTMARIEEIHTESDLRGSELYTELQDGIRAAHALALQAPTPDAFGREQAEEIEMVIENLKKLYAARRAAMLKAATIKLRTIALGK